ncbi:MAG: terpene cyclase/mutase family protein [Planctomycetaceae bacterium]|nr:terpene cyclase/mutase family protein [Planctomycetaceae bacterium]
MGNLLAYILGLRHSPQDIIPFFDTNKTEPPSRPPTLPLAKHQATAYNTGMMMRISFLLLAIFAFPHFSSVAIGQGRVSDDELNRTITRGLDWLATQQSRRGGWDADGLYPSAMTGMSGIALLAEGSTTTQGKYAPNIRAAADFLISKSRRNGLIGDDNDDRYTYGHGFGLLFLSQVLGEEEDEDRREELIDVITRAVQFCGEAQTSKGGWGYVSAKDGGDFDEGSTTITQVQALRGCRNAGIVVPREIIDKGVAYIRRCAINDGVGGIQYSLSTGGGGRPPISAAAIVCLFDAGEYDDVFVPNLLRFADRHLSSVGGSTDGFWHYAHYYYSQVKYRQGDREWEEYRNRIYRRLINDQDTNGSWRAGNVGRVYVTSNNLTILQLEKGALPIYMR